MIGAEGCGHAIGREGLGFVPPKRARVFRAREHRIHMSNSPRGKCQSSAAPVLARRGERRAFPSPRL